MLIQSIPYPASGLVIGAAPTSTEWELYFPNGKFTNLTLEVTEWEFRRTPGGSDISSTATASASSNAGGSYLPGNAIDNNNFSTWAPAVGSEVGAYLRLTFPSAEPCGEIVILCGAGSNRAIPKFELRYFDGSSRVTAYTSPTYVEADWDSPNQTKTYTFALPSFSVNPSITNTSGFTPGAVADTLTFSAGTYTINGGTATYAKKNNGSTFDTTISNYTLVSGDSGDTITFTVTLANAAGSVTATSAGLGPVAASPTYTTQNLTLSDGSTVTLSDSSNHEISNRTA